MTENFHIDPERLKKITALAHGAHEANDKQMCAMEAVAFVAGEKWSDHPQCASKVIGAFMRSWNDTLPDDERTALLLPLVPRLVGTKGSAALESRRATMAADWFIREYTPAWLRLAGLTEHADALAGFPEITNFAKVPGIRPVLEAARTDASNAGAAAWDAAGDAARDAAGAAAWDAAWDAAGAAAWDAAGAAAGDAARDAAGAAAWDAARDAARAAAGDTAWDAAGAAAGDAAGAKLKPTRDALQQSAVKLVERMIEAQEIDQ